MHRRHLQRGRADAQQVIGNARELAADHPQELAARRRLDAEQLLHRHAVADVAQDRRAVVQPVGVRDGLVVEAALALLLEAAVQVADLDVGVDDGARRRDRA